MSSNTILIYILIFLCSYLIGSIPWGFLIGRLYGVDIRKVGSGNIGATNVTRSLGKLPGRICFFLDLLKGFLPVLAVSM
ncbi:MAG: glycerol-3-phosphate acyltransferase, partial [Victivallaceae bacterium]